MEVGVSRNTSTLPVLFSGGRKTVCLCTDGQYTERSLCHRVKTMDNNIDRAMKTTAAAIPGARALKRIAGANIVIERADRALYTAALVIFTRRTMNAITVTLALLVVAIALPSIL
jgi:hypothetical protein